MKARDIHELFGFSTIRWQENVHSVSRINRPNGTQDVFSHFYEGNISHIGFCNLKFDESIFQINIAPFHSGSFAWPHPGMHHDKEIRIQLWIFARLRRIQQSLSLLLGKKPCPIIPDLWPRDVRNWIINRETPLTTSDIEEVGNQSEFFLNRRRCNLFHPVIAVCSNLLRTNFDQGDLGTKIIHDYF